MEHTSFLDSKCERIYNAIRPEGSGFNELFEKLGMARGTLSKHLKELQHMNYVVQNKDEKYVKLPIIKLDYIPPLIVLNEIDHIYIKSKSKFVIEIRSLLKNQSSKKQDFLPFLLESNETKKSWAEYEPEIVVGGKMIFDKKNPPNFEIKNPNQLKFNIPIFLPPNKEISLEIRYVYNNTFFYHVSRSFRIQLEFRIVCEYENNFIPKIVKQFHDSITELVPTQMNQHSFLLKQSMINPDTVHRIFWTWSEYKKFQNSDIAKSTQ